jgi:signal transduction histidine kinase
MSQVTGEVDVANELGLQEGVASAIRLVGHDLRNKLGVMRNSVYYLNMTVGDEEGKLAKHIAILLREIAASNRIVSDLMDLIAPADPSRTETDLSVLVERVLEQNPAPPGIEMDVRLAAVLPIIKVDPQQLGHAMGNILAYEYATLRAGDALRILSHQRKRVYIEFIDSGPGLSRGELADILNMQRTDGASSLHMGLAVARHLIELNAGSWEMESRRGIGTRFSLVLEVQ